MIKIKDNTVKLRAITPALIYMWNKLSIINERQLDDYPDDFIITSINDGKHMTGSQHYKDTAFDMRSRNFPTEESKLHFRDLMQQELGSNFTVLYEHPGKTNQHFHFQIKKGKRFP